MYAVKICEKKIEQFSEDSFEDKLLGFLLPCLVFTSIMLALACGDCDFSLNSIAVNTIET